jgi:hypothetical protein
VLPAGGTWTLQPPRGAGNGESNGFHIQKNQISKIMIEERPEPALSSIDVVHVQYPHGSKLGMMLAFSSLLPIFIIVAYTTTLFMRREMAVGVALGGQLMNEVVNLALKEWFSEHRPTSMFR